MPDPITFATEGGVNQTATNIATSIAVGLVLFGLELNRRIRKWGKKDE